MPAPPDYDAGSHTPGGIPFGIVVGELLKAVQALKSQQGEVKIYTVDGENDDGKPLRRAVTLPQLLEDLRREIRDLNGAVQELTDAIDSVEPEPEPRRRQKRSRKIRASRG